VRLLAGPWQIAHCIDGIERSIDTLYPSKEQLTTGRHLASRAFTPSKFAPLHPKAVSRQLHEYFPNLGLDTGIVPL
jgi:hypothetical protein